MRLIKRGTEDKPSPKVVCAHGRPAHEIEKGDDFTLVRYLDDQGDGPGTSINSTLIKKCTCGGGGCS
ncbi:hypothetical protein [Nonomuraea dietziae]|uniref:hypothetical protein n=1 Tax=Nonomuraea dietziae TaxID=65515 RepID=UPI0033F458FA